MTIHDVFDSLLSEPSEPPYDDEPPELAGSDAEALAEADRHLRHLRRLDAERNTTVIVFDAEIARIAELKAERLAILDGKREWHLKPVRQLHARILEADPRRKSINLPHGVLKARKNPDGIEYTDTSIFLAWAALSGKTDWFRTKYEPVKAVVKQFTSAKGDVLVTADGEVVPGVRFVPGPIVFDAEATPG